MQRITYHSRSIVLYLALFGPVAGVIAQDQWPMVIDAEGRTITIYQPQPESYEVGRFTARAAVSASTKGQDPVFGAIWMNGFLEVDRDTRMGTLTELKVTDIRFPSLTDTTAIQQWKDYLSAEIPRHAQPISVDRIIASMDAKETAPPAFKNDAPEIIYRDVPSLLVYIDGEPKFRAMENDAYEQVVNTPFFIARIKDKPKLYLGTPQVWYGADAIDGPWTLTDDVPKRLKEIAPADAKVVPLEKDANGNLIAPNIIVRTKPAELLQTKGAADMKPIQGTELLYVVNSEEDIFMHIGSQHYYILLSGRWYMAKKLDGGDWTYVPADKLPGDFAKIPEGSEKDNVLASVPGTQAAKEALMDAQIPQTAKVERSATTTITYDGDPKWKLIEGTAIYEAENSSATVLYIRERYYACDNAVWYESANATGPWKVCVEVPKEVKDIPPSSASYNVTYVNVYESTPEVVYVGYTPGYTGCYVYGPTVVYGTGFYYVPWYGPMFYYPRPCTWGFSVHYNPWTGWGMGFHYSNGWFSMSVHHVGYGGWWGPPMYHPPYHPPYHGGYYHGGYHGGYRGGGNTINIDNSTNINVDRGGNLYDRGKNPGVKPSQRPAQPSGQRPSQGAPKPSTQPATRPGNNNVLTDKQGNVYRDKGNGNVQQMDKSGKWQNTKPAQPSSGSGPRTTQPSSKPTISNDTQQQLNRDMQNRQRGQERSNSYQNYQRSPGAGSRSYGSGGGTRGGGGGMRGGGGRR
jgi:hypothetical protein